LGRSAGQGRVGVVAGLADMGQAEVADFLGVRIREGGLLEICFLEWEAAIGQGATDAQSAGPRLRAGPAEGLSPSGEKGSGRLKKNKWAAAGPAGRWADWAESEGKFLSK
jgi:hypothetical protein